jgi:hypothetical protein
MAIMMEKKKISFFVTRLRLVVNGLKTYNRFCPNRIQWKKSEQRPLRRLTVKKLLLKYYLFHPVMSTESDPCVTVRIGHSASDILPIPHS